MLSRRVRAFFVVPLALALLPLVSLAVAGAAKTHTSAKMAWMHVHAKAPIARAGALEAVAHHPTVTPHAAPPSFAFWLLTPARWVDASVERVLGDLPLARLHSARAPPAIS
jgi:hypothetical protein